MRKLKCFVASSFGSKQVDEIYQKILFPTFKELNIIPLRVDRINHNKNIDIKIIELIQSCDFGIADLTFARPSVYFEAGYLEGLAKSVIYICRNDHFESKPSDKHGNEKIHFDLITKNIIGWTTPTNEFKKKLISRIKLVTKPLIKQLLIIEQDKNEQVRFQKLSLKVRVSTLDKQIESYLLKMKYSRTNLRSSRWGVYTKKNTLVRFYAYESISLNDIRILRDNISHLSDKGSKKVIGILCSLNSIPQSRVEKGLFQFIQVSPNTYQEGNNKVYIIHSIKSEQSFIKQLREIDL